MGAYLNSKRPYTLFKSETVKPYFVDKSTILKELFPLIQEGNNYICLTKREAPNSQTASYKPGKRKITTTPNRRSS